MISMAELSSQESELNTRKISSGMESPKLRMSRGIFLGSRRLLRNQIQAKRHQILRRMVRISSLLKSLVFYVVKNPAQEERSIFRKQLMNLSKLAILSMLAK